MQNKEQISAVLANDENVISIEASNIEIVLFNDKNISYKVRFIILLICKPSLVIIIIIGMDILVFSDLILNLKENFLVLNDRTFNLSQK